jgi:hypothetical protein
MAQPLLTRLEAGECCSVTVVDGGMVHVHFPTGERQVYQLSASRLQQWIEAGRQISQSFVNECVGLMYSHWQQFGR